MSQNLIKPVENGEFGESRNAKSQHFGSIHPKRVWGIKRESTKIYFAISEYLGRNHLGPAGRNLEAGIGK